MCVATRSSPFEKEPERRGRNAMRIHKIFLFANCAAGLAMPGVAQVNADRGIEGKMRLILAPLWSQIAKRLESARPADVATPPVPQGPFIFRQPVDWTIDTSRCSLLKSTVTGTGNAKVTVYVSDNGDG